MLRIGLTGGLGSGKSTIAAIFEVLDIPVYYADKASKALMIENKDVKEAIRKFFGEQAYVGDNLNRQYLADQVFKDKEKLRILNSIVHPATLADAELWMNAQKAPYVIKEAALIFESGSEKLLDYVIGVQAPEQLRLQRAMKRDNVTKEEAMARMRQQMDEATKMNLCDYIIVNDEQQLVIPQVLDLHKKFLQLSK